MIWDQKECCILYAESIEYLRNSLGIVQLDLDFSHPSLLPYQTTILRFINRQLIELGTDNLKAKIERVLELQDLGATRIVEDMESRQFAEDIGCDIESENFYCCRFVYSWTNLLTALCIRLKFQYAYLFKPDYSSECCKCGASGETVADYESWVSNVFPEDEMFDRTNYDRSNSSWQISKDRFCDCYRHTNEDDSSSEN